MNGLIGVFTPRTERLAMKSEYRVICVEQDFRRVWSRHHTLHRAMLAARRYATRNPGSHYPFEVVSPDGTTTYVR